MLHPLTPATKPLMRIIKSLGKLKLKFIAIFAIMLFSLSISAHTWEIRVNQNQNGSLTWYIQSYHSINETACISQANQSGLIINGIQYPIQSVHVGSIVPLSPNVFGVNTSCGTTRSIYGVINTPFLGTTLNVQPYSNVACWANCNINANGTFIPPPPPVCTTCPVTGWSNTVALPGNDNGTPCDPTDDFTTANIKVNHLACANITGDKQFRVIFDPGGANVSYGPINYAAGIETNVAINIPYGTSNSTQVKVIDDDFPCEIQHGLTIPGGQYLGVRETIPPTITCPGIISVSNDPGQCGANVSFAATATDNCSATVSYSHAPGSFFPVGTTTVTATATDPSNNSSSCSFSVTVTDNEAPSITCAAAQTQTADAGVCNAAVTVAGPATGDNCGVASVTNSYNNTADASGTYPVGTTTVTWTVTDIHGNTNTCTQTITVTDNEAPSITCAAAQTQTADAGVCNAAVTVAGPATGDNCGVASVTNSYNNTADASGTYPVGTTTVTWTVTDIHGNTNTCTQTITVTDNEAPSITCAAAQTQTADAGVCKAAVTVAGPATGDNCGVASVKNSYNNTANASGTYPVGTTVVTWTVTDIHGNSSSCTQTITVTDNEKPVISVSPVLSCFASNNFGCSINLGATATDNCGVLSLTSNAPGCFPVGTTIVTWTATDIHGNVSTATQLVTRNPEINIDICAGPTRTIYRGTTSNVGPFGPQSVNLTSVVSGGTPGYNYKWTPSTGLNNSLIANPVASPLVTTTYTLTVTDSKGCTRSLSITINVLPLSSAVCSGSGNNVKFLVCHIPPGNPSNPQNICISVNALNAHLTSGSNGHNNCYLGPCQQNCFSTVVGAQNFVQAKGAVEEIVETPVIVEEPKDEPTDAFKVNVYPNPSAGEFSLKVISNSMEPIRVRIMDMNGAVKSVSNVVSKANMIKVGANLMSGTYMAEVTQGENRQVIRLVKLN